MQLSIREVYRETNLSTLPKQIRKELLSIVDFSRFNIVDIELIQEIKDKSKKLIESDFTNFIELINHSEIKTINELNKLKNIVGVSTYFIDFILLFENEFENIGDILINNNIKYFLENCNWKQRYNTVNIIKIIKKYNLFDLSINNIDQEFLSSVEKIFTNLTLTNDSVFSNNFFDEQINDIYYFDDKILLYISSFENIIYKDIKWFFDYFIGNNNEEITISKIRKLEKEFQKKYWENYSITNFLFLFSDNNTFDFFKNFKPDDLTNINMLDILWKQRYDIHNIDFYQYNNRDEYLLFFNNLYGSDVKKLFFRKKENDDYEINKNNIYLLKLIFEFKYNVNYIKYFTEKYWWVTLWKLIKIHKDIGLESIIKGSFSCMGKN
jgi:hypothetical protein